jgi:hypothetical protein
MEKFNQRIFHQSGEALLANQFLPFLTNLAILLTESKLQNFPYIGLEASVRRVP